MAPPPSMPPCQASSTAFTLSLARHQLVSIMPPVLSTTTTRSNAASTLLTMASSASLR